MRAETVSEQLFFSTVRIEASMRRGASVGTGFVHAVETDQGTAHFLVTTKHVLEGARRVRVWILTSDGDAPRLGTARGVDVDGFSDETWVGHPDAAIDVAIVPLATVFEQVAADGTRPFFRSISPAQFPSAALLAQVDAIEEVTFIGYPNGLFDSANFLPLARHGATATPLTVDYQRKPMFLIDAAVFPGSSGSPVFLLDRGVYRARNGETVLGTRFACLGIVAAMHVRQPGQPIDIGVVYKTSTIDETVDHLLARTGAHRVHRPVSVPGEITALDQSIAREPRGG